MLTLVFGLVPDICAPATSLLGLELLFFVFYFLNGLTGALAETACIMLVSGIFQARHATPPTSRRATTASPLDRPVAPFTTTTTTHARSHARTHARAHVSLHTPPPPRARATRPQDKLGTVMASIGTVSGLGCMVGPVIGGVLHDAVPSSPAWAFRLPFIVCSAAPLLLVLPIGIAVPQSYINDAGPLADADATVSGLMPMPTPAPTRLWSLSFVLGLSSVALSGTIVATLDPTLILRLEAPPFGFSDAWVSYMFMFSSIVYVAVSVPIGRLVDTHGSSARVLKATTASGFVVLALTFGLLAPFGPAAWGIGTADSVQPQLNNLASVVVAMLLKGVGSALSNNAVYPDLVMAHDPDDKMLQATISGLWNAAYAVGWAAGPFLGGLLYDVFRTNTLCVGSEQLGVCGNGSAADDAAAAAEYGCSCTWLPENGFDGFSSATALLCAVYAAVLGTAAVFNVRNRPAMRQIDLASIAAPSLDPLVATLAEAGLPPDELDHKRASPRGCGGS